MNGGGCLHSNEERGRQLDNNVATDTSTSLIGDSGFDEGHTNSIECQYAEIWDHWTTESMQAPVSPASLADLGRLLTPVSEDNMFTSASFPQDPDVRPQEAPSLHRAGDSDLYLLDTCNPMSITSRCSDSSSGHTTSRTSVDHTSPGKTTGSERENFEQIQSQPMNNGDSGTLPTKPHQLDHPGPLEEAWRQLTSGTTDMYRVLETIAPRASMPAKQQCSCPSLMARLQLVTTYPRLANVCSHASSAEQVHGSESYPLDLLLFLDGVVYQAASSILSCRTCGNDQRARLNVGLCVDWLADLARQVLESGLSRLLSTPEPQTQILGRSRQGLTTWRGGHHEDGVVAENNEARAESDKPTWDGSTLRLCVGSFQLRGTVWRMCIRELLKHRLVRMSKTFDHVIGRQGEARSVARNGSRSDPLSSESFLDSIYLRVRAKIEVLFGMLEMCSLAGSSLD